MHPDFWLQRWREGCIGFHQDRTSALLEAHWAALALPRGCRVFVPLAGKSRDMLWLAAQGHRVLGVELSSLAVEQFFAENGLAPEARESRYGTHYAAGPVEVILGDAFDLDAAALIDCAGVYDRAALVALPEPMRRLYAGRLYAALPIGCRGLAITLEYPPHQKEGPPFPVGEAEVRELYRNRWQVDLLERRDVLAEEPALAAAGVTELRAGAFRLLRHTL